MNKVENFSDVFGNRLVRVDTIRTRFDIPHSQKHKMLKAFKKHNIPLDRTRVHIQDGWTDRACLAIIQEW